jgi:hypothetical protein
MEHESATDRVAGRIDPQRFRSTAAAERGEEEEEWKMDGWTDPPLADSHFARLD